ncbi:MAG TPA: tetratricopeptide repeat protein [Thermoanaerobaculia bacterium]
MAGTGKPRLSVAEAQRQVGARLREIYRDGEAGAAEMADLTKWLASDPALAQAYAEFQRNRLPHLIEACRKVRTGQTLVAQKLFEHARTDFLSATEEDPENANAWAALGGVDVLTHREDEARQAYERALAVDPNSWIAHYNFGFYFARKGEKEAALQHLEQAMSLLESSGTVDRAAVLDDLRKNPLLAPLREDPRFARLLG